MPVRGVHLRAQGVKRSAQAVTRTAGKPTDSLVKTGGPCRAEVFSMLTFLMLSMLGVEPTLAERIASSSDAPRTRLLADASSFDSAQGTRLLPKRETLLLRLAEMGERSLVGPILLTTFGSVWLVTGITMMSLFQSTATWFFAFFNPPVFVTGVVIALLGAVVAPIGIVLIVKAVRHNQEREDLRRELQLEARLTPSLSVASFEF
jgi:multisubunit Na+/H+ antiporter MnhG subunit